MKREFQDVSLEPTAQGHAVLLDGQPIRTPAGNAFAAPTGALAAAIAQEWRAQGPQVIPQTMPLTRLANVAIDRAQAARPALIAEAAKFAATDLLCHRAEHPAALCARQAALWDPLLAWAAAELGAPLACGTGVRALDQPGEAISAIEAAAAQLDAWRLVALAHAMGVTGSVVIAFALQRGRLRADEAFAAAFVDELWQLERWGEDADARARLARMRGELDALERWRVALA